MKPAPISRRSFISQSAGVAAVCTAPAILRAASPSDRVRVATMGLHRGQAHLESFSGLEGCEVVAVCDVDQRAAESGAALVEKKTGRRPRVVTDFRRLLEDREIDALSIAAPNHWHAPAAILACSAGKHVYVEKPGSHNAREGELLVAAAKKHGRIVQMGNQRRSWTIMQEAIARLKSGIIGKPHGARTWYNATRTGIGHGKVVPVPSWLDYSLWQGPAPERPYLDNLVHYNWHWRWHWGGGELANNGIHLIDIARWGLGVDCPRRVSCTGGRYYFEDDQETPDTIMATFDFGHCQIHWENHSCNGRGYYGAAVGVEFLGEGGALLLLDQEWKAFDANGKPMAEGKAPRRDVDHFRNFVEAIRGTAKLNSPIEEGQKSTLLCHLGNIAWRTGHTLTLDPAKREILDDRAARKLWGREYRRGWEPKV